MDITGIREVCIGTANGACPCACHGWPAGQRQIVKVNCTLAPGRTLGDWSAFTLTIREDPEWPREAGTLSVPLDPSNAGGTPEVTATGTATGSTEVSFTVTVPDDPGRRRYAFDVWGTGGVAGAVSLFDATWLSVKPSVR